MSDEILIVYAYLDALHDDAKQAARGLDEGSKVMDVEFVGSESVTDAYGDLRGKWDKHRDALAEALEGVGDAFKTVSDVFKTAEDELISQLNGDS